MEKHIVSFSGGKDSTAMLQMMLQKNMKVDEIIMCDNRKEFPEMYEHINNVEKLIGRSITRVSINKSFDYWMFEHIKTKGKHKGKCGYGWASMRSRWCTTLKKQAINKYFREKYPNDTIIEYHGIAFDEPKRIAKNNDGRIIKYPLYEWKVTEGAALKYCYNLGLKWNGLYEHFKRVSCWCCPFKSIPELKSLYLYHNALWRELKDMDQRSFNNFRCDYSLNQLEERFIKEEQQKNITKLIHQISVFDLGC